MLSLTLMSVLLSPLSLQAADIWPAVRDGKVSITRSQLAMLLDKLDWRQPKTSSRNSLTML
ncbi:hypothetical protein GWG12_24580 [Escherichia coli]|nr:hypothetical protein [Escherichia coli]HAM9765507.1 transposase [Escherichia coli]